MPTFAILHRLEGVLESSVIPKQGGDQAKPTSEKPKPTVKHVVKRETKPHGKDKLLSDDTIINDDEEEEPDEAELKRRKAREEEMDEHQRIIREAEVKEKAEK